MKKVNYPFTVSNLTNIIEQNARKYCWQRNIIKEPLP